MLIDTGVTNQIGKSFEFIHQPKVDQLTNQLFRLGAVLKAFNQFESSFNFINDASNDVNLFNVKMIESIDTFDQLKLEAHDSVNSIIKNQLLDIKPNLKLKFQFEKQNLLKLNNYKELFLNPFDTFKSSIFDSMLAKAMPYITQLINVFDQWTIKYGNIIGDWLGEFILNLPEAENLINRIGGALLSVIGIINTVVGYIGGYKTVIAGLIGLKVVFSISKIFHAFKSLAFVIPVVTAAFNTLKFAFNTSPIGLLIASIVLGASLIIQHWQPIVGFFSNTFNHIKVIFSQFVNWVKPVISWVFDRISSVFEIFSKLASYFGWETDKNLNISDLKSTHNQFKLSASSSYFTSNELVNLVDSSSITEGSFDQTLEPTLNFNQYSGNYDEITPIAEINQQHQNQYNKKNDTEYDQSIKINNFINVGSYSDSVDVKNAAFEGTKDALALYDIHGGY